MLINKEVYLRVIEILGNNEFQRDLIKIFSNKIISNASFTDINKMFYEVHTGLYAYIIEYNEEDPSNKYFYQNNDTAKIIASKLIKSLEQASSEFKKLVSVCGNNSFYDVIHKKWFYEQHPTGAYLKEKMISNYDLDHIKEWFEYMNIADKTDICIRKLVPEINMTPPIQTSLNATLASVKEVFVEDWNAGKEISKGRPSGNPKFVELFTYLFKAYSLLAPGKVISHRSNSYFYKFADCVCTTIGEEKNLEEKIKHIKKQSKYYSSKEGYPSFIPDDQLEPFSKSIGLNANNYKRVLKIN